MQFHRLYVYFLSKHDKRFKFAIQIGSLKYRLSIPRENNK